LKGIGGPITKEKRSKTKMLRALWLEDLVRRVAVFGEYGVMRLFESRQNGESPELILLVCVWMKRHPNLNRPKGTRWT